MIYSIHQICQIGLLLLVPGTLIAAIYTGYWGRLLTLFGWFGVTLVVLAIWFFSLGYLLRNGLYPGATGMEGIAVPIFGGAYLGSVVIGLVIYFLMRGIRHCR